MEEDYRTPFFVAEGGGDFFAAELPIYYCNRR